MKKEKKSFLFHFHLFFETQIANFSFQVKNDTLYNFVSLQKQKKISLFRKYSKGKKEKKNTISHDIEEENEMENVMQSLDGSTCKFVT